MTAFPEIDAHGRGKQAGAAHGEAARELVREHHALVVERLAARGVSLAEARLRAQPYRDVTAAVVPALAAEIDGISRGANLADGDGWLLQLRAEVTIAPGAEEPECTTVALTGPAAAGGPLAAQNVDLPPAYRPLLIALRRSDGIAPDLLTITPAGQIGHHGMNEGGLTVLANFLHTKGWGVGVPRYLLTRIALGCSTVAEATVAVLAVPRSGPRNLLLADADGAVDLETTPVAFGRIEPRDGVLVHANHFESELAASETATDAWLLNSRRRATRLRALLDGAGRPLDRLALRELLADRDGVPHALSHHADDDANADVETVAATIADIDGRTLWSCAGPPDQGEFRAYPVRRAAARDEAAPADAARGETARAETTRDEAAETARQEAA